MLNLFPQGLEGTLVIPIFVGVLIMAAFTEVLGWDFVGVVVPGYLASVFLIEPVVGAIVVLEALVTWALAVAVDRGLTAARVTFPVFGRDRFFLILASSVVVRIALEGFVLQGLAAWLAPGHPTIESRRHELFGIGLVLVPLFANRLWAPGPRRGLFQLAVVTALVAVVLRFVLLPFTNFSLAGFDPTYDPLALAFLTSPRTQIALLVTAALASLLNRRYGWDFHGILVPAMLGLAVLAPVKLVATLVEALLILVASRTLLLLPGLRTVSVEGGRRLLLCFCLGVAYKMISARAALDHLPGYRPTDLLGFGYLLPSLLAERIWQKQNVILVFLPTLQTALAGFAITTASAFGLALVAPPEPPAPAVFPTLPQAVLTLTPWLRGRPASTLSLLQDPSRTPIAETADGYRLFADPAAPRLIALAVNGKPGGQALLAALDDWSGLAAQEAVRAGASLALGEPQATARAARALGLQPTVAAAPPAGASLLARSDRTGMELARRAIAESEGGPARSSGPSRPLAPGAALALDRARDQPETLAGAVAPYGLTATAAAGAIVIGGERWPTVVLRAGARAVVSAAYISEWGAAAAALQIAEALEADCVLAHDDDGVAVPLAAALAERRGRPHIIVRGTQGPLGADLLALASPEDAGTELPAAIRPLAQAIEGRLSLTRRVPPELAQLRAFPPGAGRVNPTVLLWLSPVARRVLSGSDQMSWTRPDLIELIKQRGLPVVRTDALAWLAAGRGAPAAPALERTERLARTFDVAQLTPRAADARLALIIDEARGLCGFSVEQGSRRALVVAGERREERLPVRDGGAARLALLRGVRTLVAGEIAP